MQQENTNAQNVACITRCVNRYNAVTGRYGQQHEADTLAADIGDLNILMKFLQRVQMVKVHAT